MKIQINGFDIELNTDETNLSVKVLDANGKELSNNTYNQSETQTDDITPVDMPSAENTESTQNEEPTTSEETTEETTEETVPTETEEPTTENENFIPDFETFKKSRLKK